MPRTGRSVYTPLDRGYVYCRDNWHTEIFHVDCRGGGAQRVFDELCHGFERAGWDIGDRSFDTRIMRRDGVTWVIGIVAGLVKESCSQLGISRRMQRNPQKHRLPRLA